MNFTSLFNLQATIEWFPGAIVSIVAFCLPSSLSVIQVETNRTQPLLFNISNISDVVDEKE